MFACCLLVACLVQLIYYFSGGLFFLQRPTQPQFGLPKEAGGFQPNQLPEIASQPQPHPALWGLATPKNALAYASICDPEGYAKDTKQYHGQDKEAVAHMDE